MDMPQSLVFLTCTPSVALQALSTSHWESLVDLRRLSRNTVSRQQPRQPERQDVVTGDSVLVFVYVPVVALGG